MRAALPWRSSLGAVVVGGPDGELVLEGAAAAVWSLLDEPRTDEELTSAADAVFHLGDHGLREALASLTRAELCHRT